MTHTATSFGQNPTALQVLPTGSGRRAASWAAQFEQVANHLAQQGKYPPHWTVLGRWCHLQRHKYRAGRLSEARIAALETLQGWRWNLQDAQWEDYFAQLAEYLAASGTYPSRRSGPGDWARRQRALQRAGDLPANRAAKLETLPGWSWGHRVRSWESRLSELAEHIAVAGGYPSGPSPLTRWVRVQRRARREGNLSPDRVASLEALPGWLWNPDAPQWDSLRSPRRYRSRGPAEQAADALQAHAALKRCRPGCLTEATYRVYLDVLAARMSDRSASLAELAAAMSPPMTKEAFVAKLRRAHALTGVPVTRVERGA